LDVLLPFQYYSSSTEFTYAYNRAGEVTDKQGPAGSAEYEWNGRGELVEAELSDGSTVSYGYDAFGRLVRRVKTPADGEVPPAAERSVYIWHGREILAEYDESAQGELELYKEYFRAAGRLVAVKMHGFHGRREPGPEGFLHTKGGLMYYHTDRLGSPVAITDRHGEPVARYAWDAYGRAMAGVFDPYNTVGFTGKQLDGATGLTYFGARWYDAASGKFMSRDPIRDGWNWHAYVGGDPVNSVDPWGLSPTNTEKSTKEGWNPNIDRMFRGLYGMLRGYSQVIGGIVVAQGDSPMVGPSDVIGAGIVVTGVADITLNYGIFIEGLFGVPNETPESIVGPTVEAVTGSEEVGKFSQEMYNSAIGELIEP